MLGHYKNFEILNDVHPITLLLLEALLRWVRASLYRLLSPNSYPKKPKNQENRGQRGQPLRPDIGEPFGLPVYQFLYTDRNN